MSVLKKIAIVVAVLVVVAAGAVGWMWHQATALPDWYTEQPADELESTQPGSEPAPPRWIAQNEDGQVVPDATPVPLAPAPQDENGADETAPPRPAPSPARRTRSSPAAKRHELRGFHRARTKKGKDHGAVKASRAVYQDGHLEIGLILDLSRLPRDELKKRDRQRYDRAVANFPGVTERDVWVGVDDEPITVMGYLQLSPQAEVRVGKLTYSLASAAKRIGMRPIELRVQLNRELRKLGLVDPEA